MRRYFRILKYWLFCILVLGSLSFKNKRENITPVYSSRNQIILNGTWKFKYFPSLSVGVDSIFYLKDFDISGWADIKVPGHWELQGFASPKYQTVDEGTGLYRTSFRIPPSLNGDQIFIRFDGVLYAYDVYVNGKLVGNWSSSFNAASFNITDWISFSEENILAVRVSTRTKGYKFDISDCWALSGIFRDVVVFATPDIYIDDYSVRTFLNVDHSAKVNVTVRLQNLDNEVSEKYSIKAVLLSPKGDIIQEKVPSVYLQENTLELKVERPEFWTAETPGLYSLDLSLLRNGEVIQEVNQKVGIREVSVEDAILKLNGGAIKLRGIDHHDLVPETGRALSEKQILKDLMLMKKANINFIRTSHYPPDRRMLDLCDSMGFYVMCEVSFASNQSLLRDSTYQDVLLQRASATLLRDKNHPSIIIWSLGNENPLTPIAEAAGMYIKLTDPTRPICYPQMGDYFSKNYQEIPDFVDIYSPHYKDAEWVKNFAAETTRPVILTEYAHSLGLSFGNMADIWAEMFRNNKIAGGAVWLFQDQGILRKANQPVDTKNPTPYVWIDSLYYYDTNTINGVDGIVYSDRTPQVDYWQLRKVYSPIQVIESEITINQGNQELNLTIYNQYDFTDLNTLDGKWELYKNRKIYNKGQIQIDCAPHDTTMIIFPVNLPGNPNENVWLLKFNFKDQKGEQVYERTINLSNPKRFTWIKDRVNEYANNRKLEVENKEDGLKIETRNFIFEIEKGKLAIKLAAKEKDIPLISSGIFARVGRKPKIADISIRDRYFSGNNDYFWEPFVIEPIEVKKGVEEIAEYIYSYSATGVFLKGEKFLGQKIEGEIHYSIKSNGSLSVSYNLKPVNATGILLEAGVSFILSQEITSFQWLGDGPYPSYPDKYQLNDFGIYCIKKDDINFNGNRSNVDIAILTDDKGNGIAILGDKANISIELINRQIVVSHNALLTGLSNKKTIPSYLVRAQDVDEITGKFEIIPLKASHWPGKLIKVFGYPNKSIQAFNPFYYSYDTSK